MMSKGLIEPSFVTYGRLSKKAGQAAISCSKPSQPAANILSRMVLS